MWTARATSSFPVPLSPDMRTVESRPQPGNELDLVHGLTFPDHAVVDVQFLEDGGFTSQSLQVAGVLNRKP
jgi:hypothetical protein